MASGKIGHRGKRGRPMKGGRGTGRRSNEAGSYRNPLLESSRSVADRAIGGSVGAWTPFSPNRVIPANRATFAGARIANVTRRFALAKSLVK